MRRAIYPGSFDPVTNGHLDIIERGCKLFDEIIISILVNPEKQPFFTVEERREMLNEVVQDLSRGRCTVRVDSFTGLLVNYAVAQQATVIVRGINRRQGRSIIDKRKPASVAMGENVYGFSAFFLRDESNANLGKQLPERSAIGVADHQRRRILAPVAH